MRAEVEAFFAACPELGAYHARLSSTALAPAVRLAVRAHLCQPTTAATALATMAGVSLGDVRAAYRFLQHDPDTHALVGSLFYPHRLRWAFAAAAARAWTADLLGFERLVAGEAVLSKTVEIHPSKGTCNYACAMCLWSDKQTLTYAERGLTADGLLATEDWRHVLRELRQGGAATLVLSGGDEVLLNREIPEIMRCARLLGFRVQLYTTGFNLRPEDSALWDELALMDQVRLSVHSPVAATYNAITGLPARLNALGRVVDNIRTLRDLRDQHHTGAQIGIGFVTQPRNHDQLQQMADFAADIGVDFLDLRKDEVDVTDQLTEQQLAEVRGQLRTVRAKAVRGDYGVTRIDLADELVSLANGQRVARTRTSECLAKYFRPTISPFGILAPCDLKAEPRFAASSFNLGVVERSRVSELVAALPGRFVPDACAQCMPSSRTGNAVYAKLLADHVDGIGPAHQPFLAARERPDLPAATAASLRDGGPG